MRSRSIIPSILLLSCVLSSPLRAGDQLTLDEINSYSIMPLDPADVMPTQAEVLRQKPRVIVLNFEDSQWRGGGEVIADKVLKELNDAAVTIVDRSLAGMLRQEIDLAEARGNGGYLGQDVADYAITGKITGAGASEAYNQYLGASTTGAISIALKIVQLPTLQTVKIFNIDGRVTAYGGADQGAVLSAAVEKAVGKTRDNLKSIFSPRGYVLEHRTSGSTHLFKTTLGRSAGAAPGMKVVFLKTIADRNPLTGLVTNDLVAIGEGIVADFVVDSYSYISVSDEKTLAKIRLGDQVKVLFRESDADFMSMQ